MNRWLLIGSLACLLIGTTGCLHHNTRGGCDSGCAGGACAGGGGGHAGAVACGPGCNNGACGAGGACSNGARGGGIRGMAGKMAGLCGLCGGQGGCRPGCRAGAIGWQQGGLDYSSHLQTGLLGHTAARNLQSRPFTAGPPTGQVAYPYYTIRGPRDFFLDNPPSIGR